MRTILVALLVAIAGATHAEVQVFEQVEWQKGSWPWVLPNDDGPWTRVSLPHNWYSSSLLGSNWGAYRIRYRLDHATSLRSIYLPRVRMGTLVVHVNGRQVWASYHAHKVGVSFHALLIPIPPGVLREGENIIDLGVSGDGRWFSGFPRVYLGDSSALARRAAARDLLQGQMIYIVPAALGAIGLLSLGAWIRAGRDAVLFWYGVSGVMLLLATTLYHFSYWHLNIGDQWRTGLVFMRYHGYLVPFFILHLRLAGRRHYWLEGALWLVLIYAFYRISAPEWTGATAWFVSGLAFSVLPALLTIPLLMSRRLRTEPAVLFLVLADFAVCLLPLHDWAARLGYLDLDRPYLTLYAPAFVMLAAAAPIIVRMQAGKQEHERSRLELERRVVEKTREIEASHEQLRQAQREAALAEERRRIMADMHDGIGARLVALLSIAQSGKARHGEITDGLAAALDDLRLAVDSVQPVEGDVGVVLGNVRHRMRSVFERSGIKLNWNVSEMPRIEDLTPERILAIQRIFLEAFSNAIRHSSARTVSVFTVRVPGAVRIVIEDDGGGFDVDAPHAGTGLHNLKLRALQAGGTLQVESETGKGTRVTLALPLDGGDTQKPLPDTGQNSEIYPVVGIPANATSS